MNHPLEVSPPLQLSCVFIYRLFFQPGYPRGQKVFNSCLEKNKINTRKSCMVMIQELRNICTVNIVKYLFDETESGGLVVSTSAFHAKGPAFNLHRLHDSSSKINPL